MRLDKFLAAGLGLGSRADVKKLIKAGRVQVEGTEKLRPETNIDPKTACVYVDGVLQKYREFVYLMLNKPEGYISATRDPRLPVVTEFVPQEFKHLDLFPVGRLDIDAEGLCILTNDGDLAHRLLSPKKHVPKTYEVKLERSVTHEDILRFKQGIALEDGFLCAPASLEAVGEKAGRVVIHEGKFHQVKRMFEAVGNKVLYLKRTAMNGLELDGTLGTGEIRELTEAELALLNKQQD